MMESREQYTLLSEPESSAAMKSAEQTHALEKRGPYIMSKAPSFHTAPEAPRHSETSSAEERTGFRETKDVRVKFNKGYAALSQTGEDSLVSLDSDSDAELDCSSGYSSAEVHPDLSRQLLKDGYHLDEIPDDEDLDLIPPKALSSSACCCCCVQ